MGSLCWCPTLAGTEICGSETNLIEGKPEVFLTLTKFLASLLL